MRDVAVRIAGLCKAFGANDVLKGIDLDLPAGAVTALMGANGAGKSTLVKVLSGVHAADAGRVSLAGAGFAPESPAAAMAAGVVTVHQSIADGVVGDLDVASNLMLDRLAKPGGGLFVNRRRLREGARAAAAAVGLDADLSARVADLSLADRQLVAIARALAHSPRLLILDEPTSSLSAAEAERLFALIDRLREEGVCILYISHRMSDIRRIADRIASMRDGRITGLFDGESLDYEGAVRAMLGHGLAETGIVSPARGRDVLRLDGLRLRPGGAPLTLALGEGEVVAVTGLVGAGKTALAEALFGLRPVHGGAMALDGAPYAPRAAAEAVARGVFLCAKDRAANGAIPDFDLAGNVTLPFLSRYATASLLNRGAQRARTRELIAALGVICRSERDPIGALSGGNQQKIMVARWLSEPCRVLVLDEPFQGVDIQARRDIGAKIRETAGDRATVVMVAELDEALEIADRIVVMSDGAVVGEHLAGAVDLEAVLGEVAGAARGAAA